MNFPKVYVQLSNGNGLHNCNLSELTAATTDFLPQYNQDVVPECINAGFGTTTGTTTGTTEATLNITKKKTLVVTPDLVTLDKATQIYKKSIHPITSTYQR